MMFLRVSDEDLMRAVVKGNIKAFDKLFERYSAPIYNYCQQRLGKKELAQEITQECFLRLWEKSEKFNPERSFKIWFWTLVRNRLNDYWREAYKEADPSELSDEFSESDMDEFEKLLQKENKEKVEKVFFSLNETYREMLSMWIQDLSYEEMAQITGKSLDSIKSTLKRAKSEFRRMYEKHT